MKKSAKQAAQIEKGDQGPKGPISFDLQSCQLNSVSLVEAAAGTGKTFTISRLFLRLILEGWNIKNILVVTFTEAATRELRRRLRSSLRECLTALMKLSPSADSGSNSRVDSEVDSETDSRMAAEMDSEMDEELRLLLKSCSSISIDRMIRRLKQALSHFNEASIFTIHAFCNRALQEYPFESNSFFEFDILPNDDDLLQEIVLDFWREEVASAPVYIAEFAQTMRITASTWIDLLQTARTKQHLRLSHTGRKMDLELLAIFESDFEGLRSQWESALLPLQRLLQDWEMMKDKKIAGKGRGKGWMAEDSRQVLQSLSRHFGGKRHLQSHLLKTGALLFNIEKKEKKKNLKEWELLQKFSAKLASPDSLVSPNSPGSKEALAQDFTERGAMASKDQAALLSFISSWKSYWHRYQQVMAALLSHFIFLTTRLLESYPQKLSEKQERQSRLSYNDLLIRLHRAIKDREKGPRLLASLRQRYRAALIDEFQDTDRLQWEILSAIFVSAQYSGKGSGRAADRDASSGTGNGASNGTGNGASSGTNESPLFLVGDPKQSIYSFRGANLEVYLKARQQVQHYFYLDQNYRATEKLTAGINSLFSSPSSSAFSPFLHPRISYFPISSAPESPSPDPLFTENAGRQAGEQRPSSTIQFLILPAEQANKKIDEVRSAATEAVCGETARLLSLKRAVGGGRSLEPRDIAVLVRTHDEAHEMQEALQKRGIATVQYSKESIFQSQEASDLEVILGSLMEAGSAPSVKRILATETFGYTAEEILALSQDEKEWEELVVRFIEYRELWQRAGFIAMFQSLLLREKLGPKILKRSRGERALTNLTHLAELIHKNQNRAGSNALHFLRSRIQKEICADDSEELRLESDDDALQIITIHASKGLEFPVVFCPYLWRSSNAGNASRKAPLCYSHQEEMHIIMPLFLKRYLSKMRDTQSLQEAQEAQRSQSTKANDASEVEDGLPPESRGEPSVAKITEQAKEELMAEEMRLLYVALTRASQRLYLVWADHKDSHKTALSNLLLKGELQGKGSEKMETNLSSKRESSATVRAKESSVAVEAIRKLAREYPDSIAIAPIADSITAPVTDPIAVPIATPIVVPVGAQADAKMGAEAERGGLRSSLSKEQPTQRSAELAPRLLGRRVEAGRAIWSFSSLSKAARQDSLSVASSKNENENEMVDFSSIHCFPRGAVAGLFFHELLEKSISMLSSLSSSQPSTWQNLVASPEYERLVTSLLGRYNFSRGWKKMILATLEQLWQMPLSAVGYRFSLADISLRRSISELGFYCSLATPSGSEASSRGRGRSDSSIKLLPPEIEAIWKRDREHISIQDGYVRGYIDLIFEYQGYFFLIDWKSNWLGADQSGYSAESIGQDIEANCYSLQYYIYTDALDRFLQRRLANYSFEKNYGGAFYIYLRGVNGQEGAGIYYDRPSQQSLEAFRRTVQR